MAEIEMKRADVRTMTFGDLQVNLTMSLIEVHGISQAIQQLEMMKEQQKMVADPPQLAQVKQAGEEARYRVNVIKAEIDRRMHDIDQRRMAEYELEVEVMPRFLDYLRKNELWGNLHVVMEDGNVEDHHIEACIKRAEEAGDAEGAELGRILLERMGEEHRKGFVSRAILPEDQERSERFAQGLANMGKAN